MTIKGTNIDSEVLKALIRKVPSVVWGFSVVAVVFTACAFFITKSYAEIKPALNTNVEVQQEVIQNFKAYRENQDKQLNDLQKDVSNLMYLIEELNKTTTKKLDIILQADNTNSKQVMLMLELLDDNFSKIIEVHARQQKELRFYQMRDTIKTNKHYKIGIK